MLRSVERRHLNGRDGFQTLLDSVAHNAVHVAIIDQRAGMAVIGTQNKVARIKPVFGDGLDLLGHIIPGGTKPQH